jgi:hypothetical protein
MIKKAKKKNKKAVSKYVLNQHHHAYQLANKMHKANQNKLFNNKM